jgi:hypothetical protein
VWPKVLAYSKEPEYWMEPEYSKALAFVYVLGSLAALVMVSQQPFVSE